MSIEEFREKLKNNRTLKVASRAFDRTFSPKNLIEDYWKIFLIAYAIGAIYVYFKCRPNTEPTEFDALMYAVGIFIGCAGTLYVAKYGATKFMQFIDSVSDVSNELKHDLKEQGQTVLTEVPPINKELLSQYLSAKFKGMGANENYVPQLLKDLEILQKTSPTEVQRFAVMLYESKVMVNKPAQFNEWVKIFFNIVGMEHPKYISRSKHKPTQEMIDHYYYINLP